MSIILALILGLALVGVVAYGLKRHRDSRKGGSGGPWQNDRNEQF